MFEPQQVKTAAALQRCGRERLIFWSSGLRELTAIAGFVPGQAAVINELDTDDLLERISATGHAVNIGVPIKDSVNAGAPVQDADPISRQRQVVPCVRTSGLAAIPGGATCLCGDRQRWRYGRQEPTARTQSGCGAERAVQDRAVCLPSLEDRAAHSPILAAANAATRLHGYAATRLRGYAAGSGFPTSLREGPAMFLLFGPVYLRESQVAKILGVSKRQVAAWSDAGLLQRVYLVAFPDSYGYRRLDVICLANTPGPIATRIREQMYRERNQQLADVSCPPASSPPGNPSRIGLNSGPRCRTS
jgi:hypothetical protein